MSSARLNWKLACLIGVNRPVGIDDFYQDILLRGGSDEFLVFCWYYYPLLGRSNILERIFRSPSFYEFSIWSPHFLLFDFLITLIGKKKKIIVWFTLTFAGFSNRYLILI